MLDPEVVLELLREAGNGLRESRDPEDAMRGIGALLVPAVADRATVYIRENDGRLYELGGRARTRKRGTGVEGAGEADGSLAPDSGHPASAACRAGAIAFVTRGRVEPTLHENGSMAARGTDITEVALPLRRESETVGVLYLALNGAGRSYAAEDLIRLEGIGDRVSVALENIRLRREIEVARRVKADFLSVMSHELRTPLTAVVGYADLLEAGIPGPVTEKQVWQLERIKESAWELLELIDGILGYARYESEDTEVSAGQTDAAIVLEDALLAIRPALEEKGLGLSVEVAADLPPLRTDHEKATRILVHLLSNAEKFTDRGEIEVVLEADRDWFLYTIRDPGPGIAPSEVRQIFEPFWQGEQAETRTKGGTGMGLSLAQRLAELLSGEIVVESTPGAGSAFTLRLPREGPHPTFE